MHDVAHFNNAGCSLPPKTVTDTVKGYIDFEERFGGYEAREAFEPQISAVYSSLAQLIGASADEIALADSATRAWDMVFYGLALAPGDRIITCMSEYGGNAIAYLHRAKQTGGEIVVVENDPDGQIDLRRLEEELGKPRTRLMTMNHIPTQGGLVNPAERIGELCREAGVLFLLDACQSVGQLDLSVARLHCDVLTGTGRKYLRGPRGTGFAYVRSEAMALFEPAFLDGRSATWLSPGEYELASTAIRYETWEKNYANLLGLGAAADYALGLGMSAIEASVLRRGTELRDALREVPGVTIADQGARHCGIVSFTLTGVSPDRIMSSLRQRRINVSVSRARSSRWDLPRRGLESVVRASAHYFNSSDEVAALVSELTTLGDEAKEDTEEP
ncbi:aminotransferase class V-fold PLP-dependent enzyme [Microbacterium betulae]|uniref:Aminotransferase class V-fold PLP-dependent enzyme n=1 Tax=Microbacterium betulae TaxID=2981139 RepID=A0AA97I7S9_9MICO|nr:aminotransferase class V-fold PLP-dependent enzyme [Microbacterium sp. AB]WOF23957.1 aminotransferase class V-fold PLP-dependent enzyme [Microbacterium sp. AB]